MRPKSIVMFERLFLASLVLGALNFLLSYEAAVASVANDPSARQLGLGSGFFLGVTVVSFAVYLLLWFLVARRASVVAKWILSVFVGIGVLLALWTLTGPWTVTLALSLVIHAIEVLAVVYLFRPDATAWLGGTDQPDPAPTD